MVTDVPDVAWRSVLLLLLVLHLMGGFLCWQWWDGKDPLLNSTNKNYNSGTTVVVPQQWKQIKASGKKKHVDLGKQGPSVESLINTALISAAIIINIAMKTRDKLHRWSL